MNIHGMSESPASANTASFVQSLLLILSHVPLALGVLGQEHCLRIVLSLVPDRTPTLCPHPAAKPTTTSSWHFVRALLQSEWRDMCEV